MAKILLCVCGGIAAYKVCAVASYLKQQQVDVTVAMSEAAQKLVGPATFQALTANPVYTDLWEHPGGKDPQHIRLAREADLVLVAPATANIVGKLANGIADGLIATLLLAADPKKVMLAPAMNEGMWQHPAMQRNLKFLQEIGIRTIGPATGWQACQTVGVGRMSEADEICREVLAAIGVK
ncbi:MAG: flavoprotein [Phycisphaerae bacterium]